MNQDVHTRPASPPTLSDAHRKHLHTSALSDETIEKAGIYTVFDADQAAHLLNRTSDGGAKVTVPALVFPYEGTDGYARLRVWSSTPRETNSHDYSATEVPSTAHKYLAPTAKRSRIYAPTALNPAILDPSEYLWAGEGEKKALSGCQGGLAMVSAPGVFCFGKAGAATALTSDEHELHEDFDRLSISGRKVVICFDSDIDSNPDVLLAATRLGTMLKTAGANPAITYIPGNGDAKVGLDDYLASLPAEVRCGPNPFKALIEAVRPLDPYDCIETFIATRYRDWSPTDLDREVRRVALVAARMLDDTSLDSWCRHTAKKLDLTQRQVRNYLPKRKKERVDALTWVSSWLEANEVSYSMKTERVTIGGQDITSISLFQRMALDANASGGPGAQFINYALDIWLEGEKRRALESLRTRLRHAPCQADLLSAWVHAVTGNTDEVDRAVIAHFLWQVKRKLYGLPVEHHLMPLLHGGQGSGKTTAVMRLLAPMEEFTDLPGDLAVLGDTRELFRLNSSFVLFFDEMARANRVDVESLKNRITQDTLRWRALSLNRISVGANNATFIGATNTNLTDLIYDPTGVRRFYQIECQNPANWEVINSLDYFALWQSIDESGPAPVLTVLDALKERQEAMRPKDSAEEFLAARCDVGGDAWTAASVVYEQFKAFLDGDMRSDKWSFTRFGRRAKELLGAERVKTSNGVKYNLSLLPTGHLMDAVDDLLVGDKAANESMKKVGTKSA